MLNTIKPVCFVFCWNILEIFFCKQCRLSLIWVNTVCRSTDSKTIKWSTSADDMPSQYPISGYNRPAREMPFGWCFACRPIVARFTCLLGIRRLITNLVAFFFSNLQRYDAISAHVPKRVSQFASEFLQYIGMAFI